VQRSPSVRARAAATAPQPPRARFTGRAAIFVLVLAVLVVSYASSMRAYFEQRQHLASLRASIASSQGNIEDLRREKNRWRDPAYVEAQARARFGWVMPGEIGYQVIGEDGEPLTKGDSLSDPGVATDADRPLWWQSAWGTVLAAGNPPDEPPPPAAQIRAPKKLRR